MQNIPKQLPAVFARPREALLAIRVAPDINKFCAMIFDAIAQVLTGRRPYEEEDKVTQQLVSFVVQAGGELIKSDRGYAESGVYCITDVDGNRGAYKMVRLNGEISVHKLRVRSFDDLDQDANSISSDRVHMWSTNRLTNTVFDLRQRVGIFGMLDSISPSPAPPLSQNLGCAEELVQYLYEYVGIDAMRSAKKGAERLGTQSIYFQSPGRYYALTFTEISGSLRITEEIFDEKTVKSRIIQHGTVHGVNLNMLNFVMFDCDH